MRIRSLIKAAWVSFFLPSGGNAEAPPLAKYLDDIGRNPVSFQGPMIFAPPNNFALSTDLGRFKVVLDSGRELREAIQSNCLEPCQFSGIGFIEVRDADVWLAISSGEILSLPPASGTTSTDVTGGANLSSIQRCWNVGSLSREALQTIITVAFEVDHKGAPVIQTISVDAAEGPNEAAISLAFEATRRAILRCGSSGYAEVNEGQKVLMTFDARSMRINYSISE